mmetsp:Transcript_32309/g.82270  ORF Transcript_32309/g.82270 Transcript_32309/m.82270 type:complete len:581 (+) Transcript_32309:36-1778(+)
MRGRGRAPDAPAQLVSSLAGVAARAVGAEAEVQVAPRRKGPSLGRRHRVVPARCAGAPLGHDVSEDILQAVESTVDLPELALHDAHVRLQGVQGRVLGVGGDVVGRVAPEQVPRLPLLCLRRRVGVVLALAVVLQYLGVGPVVLVAAVAVVRQAPREARQEVLHRLAPAAVVAVVVPGTPAQPEVPHHDRGEQPQHRQPQAHAWHADERIPHEAADGHDRHVEPPRAPSPAPVPAAGQPGQYEGFGAHRGAVGVEAFLPLLRHRRVRVGETGNEQVHHADAEDQRAAVAEQRLVGRARCVRHGQVLLAAGGGPIMDATQQEVEVDAMIVAQEQEAEGAEDDLDDVVVARAQRRVGLDKGYEEEEGDHQDADDPDLRLEDADDLGAELLETVRAEPVQHLVPLQHRDCGEHFPVSPSAEPLGRKWQRQGEAAHQEDGGQVEVIHVVHEVVLDVPQPPAILPHLRQLQYQVAHGHGHEEGPQGVVLLGNRPMVRVRGDPEEREQLGAAEQHVHGVRISHQMGPRKVQDCLRRGRLEDDELVRTCALCQRPQDVHAEDIRQVQDPDGNGLALLLLRVVNDWPL